MAAAVLAPLPDRGLAAAFVVALALHLAALGGLTAWRTPATAPPGRNEIAIDLAPAMQDLEAPAPSALSESRPDAPPAEADAPRAPAEAPPEPLAQAVPEEAVQPPAAEAPDPPVTSALVLPPDERVIDTPAPLADALPPPVPAPVEAPPMVEPPRRPVERRTPRPVERPKAVEKPRPPPKASPRREARETAPERPTGGRAAPSAPSARSGAATASRENAGGAAASADPGALARYAAQLAASIRGRLRYPAAAQGARGTAAVRITMERSGRVLSVSLARSAGHPVLDAAALATVPAGSTLPAPPDGLLPARFAVPVPLRFDIR